MHLMIRGRDEPRQPDAQQHLDRYRTGDVYQSLVRVRFSPGHHASAQDVRQRHAERYDCDRCNNDVNRD